MFYVKLPKHIQFSSFREVDKKTDEFDLIVDGKIVHTMQVGCDQIKGSSDEAFVHARAHVDAKQWLREHNFVPAD